VLGDKATGSFLGGRSRAKASRPTPSNRSRQCARSRRHSNAKPELEIFADDVQCAHGATVGDLDQNQLFSAAARGLDPASARALLLEGFVGGLWDIDGGNQASPTPRARAEGHRMNIRHPNSASLRDRLTSARLALSRQRRDRAEAAAVIDAITRAYGHDYATVHRSVYERSAAMTASGAPARPPH
jgi:hypothetical protein